MASEDLLKWMSRVRTLEGRFNDLRERINFAETNVNNLKKSIREETGDLSKEIRKTEGTLEEIQNLLETVRNELSLRVPKEDFEVIRKYLDYINPVRFVTADQVVEIVERMLEHKTEAKIEGKKEEKKKK